VSLGWDHGRAAGRLGNGGECRRLRGNVDAVTVKAIVILGPTPNNPGERIATPKET
jgi:hypothetical protein